MCATWSTWTHLTLRLIFSQTQVGAEALALLAFWIISCLLNICLIFKFFFLGIAAFYLLSVHSLGALFFYGGVVEMCVCALHSADMVSCVLPA